MKSKFLSLSCFIALYGIPVGPGADVLDLVLRIRLISCVEIGFVREEYQTELIRVLGEYSWYQGDETGIGVIFLVGVHCS